VGVKLFVGVIDGVKNGVRVLVGVVVGVSLLVGVAVGVICVIQTQSIAGMQQSQLVEHEFEFSNLIVMNDLSAVKT
jgi:hypothetical protein